MEIIGASILVSVITTKILATYYFKKVDGYVKDIHSTKAAPRGCFCCTQKRRIEVMRHGQSAGSKN